MEKYTNKNIMKKVKGEMERNGKDEMKKAYRDWERWARQLEGEKLQDKWERVATWNAHTLKIKPQFI